MDMKFIEVSNAAKMELMKIFGVTRQAVWMALSFKSDSAQAQKIRNVALRQKGGRVMIMMDITDGYMPNCQVVFDRDANGVTGVHYTFPNRVKVDLDCLQDMATITMDEQEIRRYWNVGSAEAAVLFDAEQLSNQ